MAARVDATIGAVAQRQHGLITRGQLLALGLNDTSIGRRLRAGSLYRLHAGVYAVGHLPTSPIAHAAAAVLACGPRAVLSHESAASLWGVLDHWQRPFEVTVAGNRQPPEIRVHRAHLTRRDIRTHLGIRVTSPARTLLDVANRLDEASLTRAYNDLRLAAYLGHADLAELLERCRGCRGAGRVRPLVTDRRAPTRSQFEDAFVAFCTRFGLPRPQLNVKLAGHEVDASFADEALIVELDGYETHGTRGSFESDRDRDADTLAAGYATVRVTWERLIKRPRREATRLTAILEARR